MLIEHSNLKAWFFSYIEATSQWSRKPLYFEVLFLGPDFGQREHINSLQIRLTALMESILIVKSKKNSCDPPTNDTTIQQEAS